MNQTFIDFDVCSARHRGNANSVAAFKAGDKEQTRAKVLAAIEAAGANGVTCYELSQRWNCGQNQVSGRFTELAQLGFIRKCGTRPTQTGSQASVYVRTQ